MQNEEKLLKNRFEELAARSKTRGIFCYTDFLNFAAQDVLLSHHWDVSVKLFGGFEEAERQIARFGDENLSAWDEPFPIVCVHVKPASQKLAEDLSHRDFLGALLACGVRREKIGDILVYDNSAYIFCNDAIADFVKENLTEVRHTSVKCSFAEDIPKDALPKPEEKTVVIASERLDALVAAVYNLSRSDSQDLFVKKKIFVNSRMTENTSFQPENGDVISVRGYGRFIYEKILKETQKGRLRVLVKVF